MKSKKPNYYDVIVHLSDRPIGSEEYLSKDEICEEVKQLLGDLPAGVKVKDIRIRKIVQGEN